MSQALSLPHQAFCIGLSTHLPPIGFDTDEPEFEYHGESVHPDRVGHQCMCGHPDYSQCPDFWGFWVASVACCSDQHALCDRAGWHRYVGELQPETCSCECHQEVT